MTIIDVYNLQKEKVSQLELKEAVFNVPIKKHLLHQVVVSQLLNRRSGSASTIRILLGTRQYSRAQGVL